MTRRRDDKVEVKYSAPTTTAPANGSGLKPVLPVEVEEIKEESLTRLEAAHKGGQEYKVRDGEFVHYPEIQVKTADKLKARGILNLFPIQ